MRSSAAQRLADFRRAGRLLWRHCRFGPAQLSAAGRCRRLEALVRLYRVVNAHLAELGVEYWINFGTLLGWHRSGSILEHDKDVDFGAPVDAYARLCAARSSLPAGVRLFDTSHRHSGPKLYYCQDGWEADVYFYAEEQGQLYTRLKSSSPGETAPFPRSWIYPLKPVVFHGAATFIPAETEQWLRHTYGYLGPDAVRDRATGYFRPRQGKRS